MSEINDVGDLRGMLDTEILAAFQAERQARQAAEQQRDAFHACWQTTLRDGQRNLEMRQHWHQRARALEWAILEYIARYGQDANGDDRPSFDGLRAALAGEGPGVLAAADGQCAEWVGNRRCKLKLRDPAFFDRYPRDAFVRAYCAMHGNMRLRAARERQEATSAAPGD